MIERYILLIEIAPEFAITGVPPVAMVGSPYSFAFATEGHEGAVAFSLAVGSTLPSGWALSSAGELTHASVDTPGRVNFTLRAADATMRFVEKAIELRKANPLP